MGEDFAERSIHNIDQKKYNKNSDKIFGKREKLPCQKCGLSTLLSRGKPYKCSHCDHEGIVPSKCTHTLCEEFNEKEDGNCSVYIDYQECGDGRENLISKEEK